MFDKLSNSDIIKMLKNLIILIIFKNFPNIGDN